MISENNKLNLPPAARVFVLYQRTGILPKRKISFLDRVINRIGMRKNSYESFVQEYAKNNGSKIDEDYSNIMNEEAKSLIEKIPSQTRSILDIGCGIAALQVYLYRLLNKPDIYLLDKTELESKVWYMFEPKGAFYNSMELASDVLTSNGIPDQKIKTLEAPDDGIINLETGSIDFVISTISWGFHFPVSTYLKSVVNVLSENGILIIDIRKDTGGENELKTEFQIEPIRIFSKYITYRCKKIR